MQQRAVRDLVEQRRHRAQERHHREQLEDQRPAPGADSGRIVGARSLRLRADVEAADDGCRTREHQQLHREAEAHGLARLEHQQCQEARGVEHHPHQPCPDARVAFRRQDRERVPVGADYRPLFRHVLVLDVAWVLTLDYYPTTASPVLRKTPRPRTHGRLAGLPYSTMRPRVALSAPRLHLGVDAAALRAPGRLGRLARNFHRGGLLDKLVQPRQRVGAILLLAAVTLCLDHDDAVGSDPLIIARKQPRLDRIRERRCADVVAKVQCRRNLVDILSARTLRANGGPGDLVGRNRDHRQAVHLPSHGLRSGMGK